MSKENASKLIDDYIASAPKFARPICSKLRELIFKAEPDIKEEWKWGPNYQLNGMVCGYAAFKAHVHFTFFNGAIMKDNKNIFTEGLNNRRSRGIKFKSIEEINEKVIITYVKESVKINKLGKKTAEKVLKIPPDLKKTLSKEKLLKKFESLAHTHRKEYISWITGAKKEETRSRRLDKSVQMIKEGKKLS